MEDAQFEEVDYDMEVAAPSVITYKLNIFGVSNLSTKEIIAFLHTYFPGVDAPEITIEWINDETCNATFPHYSLVDVVLAAGTLIEGGDFGSVSITCPPTVEGGDSHPLTIRRANAGDVKKLTHSWKESNYYKKRLAEKGINPVTLKPVSRVILKPREGVTEPSRSSKVTLIPRTLVKQAKTAIYGEDAFSRKKERSAKRSETLMVDDEELKRRDDRAKRFSSQR